MRAREAGALRIAELVADDYLVVVAIFKLATTVGVHCR